MHFLWYDVSVSVVVVRKGCIFIMSKLGGKNKDSKKALEKRMKQQLAAVAKKQAAKKK